MTEKTQNDLRLVVGAEIISLEMDCFYAVKLPSDVTMDEVEKTHTALWRLRLADPEHAPRFIVCRRDVEIEPIDDVMSSATQG